MGPLALAGAAAPFALNLAAMGEAAAFNANDYKALVCVFLFGGSDYAHTVVNYDEVSHAKYAKIRGVDGGARQCAFETGEEVDGVGYFEEPEALALGG